MWHHKLPSLCDIQPKAALWSMKWLHFFQAYDSNLLMIGFYDMSSLNITESGEFPTTLKAPLNRFPRMKDLTVAA